jgi:hypothetical protein
VAFWTSAVDDSSGGHALLVGVEEGLPIRRESLQKLLAAWTESAQTLCSGPYIGSPSLQVTSFAAPGHPFADPFARGSDSRFTAVFGHIHCTSILAARMANYVSKPTADSSSHSSNAVVRGGLTRR